MTRRYLLVATLVGFFLSAACGWAAEGSGKGPKAYLPENVFEFRPVVEGTELVHQFRLKNQGDAPLRILKIQSG